MNVNLVSIVNALRDNPWLTVCLSTAISLLGWSLGGRVSGLLVRWAERFSLPGRIAYLLHLRDPQRISVWMRWILRWIIFLASLWAAWRMLATHPAIIRIVGELQRPIPEFLRLPVVAFLLDVVLIALETFLLYKLVGWVKRRFTALETFLEAERETRFSAWRIRRVELLSAKQVADLAFRASRYFRYAVNLLLILGYLTGIFSLFPQTRGYVLGTVDSMSQILSEGWLAFVNYLPDLFSLILIIVVTYFGLRFLHFLFHEIERGTITLSGFFPEWAEPTYTIVRALVIVLALVVAFPFLPGSSSPAFQGVSIFLGALLSLGSTSVVGNIVAGIILTYAQAFRVGDRVQIGDTIGDVTGKGLIATRIRTIKNVDVTVPNGLVMANHIVNFSSEAELRGLILHTTVTIGYDAPWRKVHETLIRAALSTRGVLADPRPFVFQTSLDDSYVSYEINAYTREPLRMANIYSEMNQNIQDKFNEEGIEILSPHFNAVRDGNTSTIPADHRPAEYRPPAFRVKIDRGQ
jgi:small-conductance mechanosensitive channel